MKTNTTTTRSLERVIASESSPDDAKWAVQAKNPEELEVKLRQFLSPEIVDFLIEKVRKGELA